MEPKQNLSFEGTIFTQNFCKIQKKSYGEIKNKKLRNEFPTLQSQRDAAYLSLFN